MDLFCPHCTRRVTVPDEKAGLILNCPLCAKQFMAPSLAPTAPAPKPPPPASPPPSPHSAAGRGTMSISPSMVSSAPAPTPAPVPPTPPPPPPPPGDYTRSCTLQLRGKWLPFVPMLCLLLILLLSFFPWEQPNDRPAVNLWGLAFHPMAETKEKGAVNPVKNKEADGRPEFLVYTLVFVFCILLAFGSLLFEKGVLPTSPSLAPFLRWKDLIVGLFLGVAFVFLVYVYVDAHMQRVSPILIPMKIAFRLHGLAIIACFLMFWLHWRKMKNLPPVKLEMRW